mgnify:CR=1 FL=1
MRHPALGTADGMRSLDAQRPCGSIIPPARHPLVGLRYMGRVAGPSASNPDVVFFQVYPTCRGDGNRGGRRGGGFFSAHIYVLRGVSVAKLTDRAGEWGGLLF